MWWFQPKFLSENDKTVCPPTSAPQLCVSSSCRHNPILPHTSLITLTSTPHFFLFSLDCTSYHWDNPTMGSWLHQVTALCVVKGPEFLQKIFTKGHILNSLSASYVSWLVLAPQLSNSPFSPSYGTGFILTNKNLGTDHNYLHGRVVGRSLSVSKTFVS